MFQRTEPVIIITIIIITNIVFFSSLLGIALLDIWILTKFWNVKYSS